MAAAAAAAAICINTDRQKMVTRQCACGGTRQGAKGKCVFVHPLAMQSLVLINKRVQVLFTKKKKKVQVLGIRSSLR